MATLPTKAAPRLERRDISALTPHPDNEEVFADLDDDELRRFADDIEERGLQDPVDILPDGTIIAGHQRVRAAELLGKKKILCRVRYDLEEAGPAAIKLEMIKSNLVRRHLKPLGVARAMRELQKIKDAAEGDSNGLAEELAEVINRSTRNARRYLRVLETPREVQDAFERGELTLNQANSVASLAEAKQQQIVNELMVGGSAKAAVAAARGRKSSGPEAYAGRTILQRVKQIVADVPELANAVADGGTLTDQQIKLLSEAALLLGAIADKAASVNEQRSLAAEQRFLAKWNDIQARRATALAAL